MLPFFSAISHYIPFYPSTSWDILGRFLIPLCTYWDIMSGTDHAGYKKVQVWIPESLWDSVESLNFPNATSAVTEAFNVLLEKSQKDPEESQEIPRLTAIIEGLQLLLQEKDQRIEDLRKDKETLSIFAHYFKSLEYKRIETTTPERQESTREAPRETRSTQEKREKALIRKKCKHCGEEFETDNPRRETCSNKCRQAFHKEQQTRS